MNKKAILGFDTVKSVILALGIIAIFVVVSMLILVTLRTSIETVNIGTGTAINETVTSSKTAGLSATLSAGAYRNGLCGSITAVYNGTFAPISINVANFTQTNCAVVNASSMNTYHTSLLFNYPYTIDQPYTNEVVENITKGGSNFFSQVPTFFVLLGVVVLILIIAIVIVAVSRFGGGMSRESL